MQDTENEAGTIRSSRKNGFDAAIHFPRTSKLELHPRWVASSVKSVVRGGKTAVQGYKSEQLKGVFELFPRASGSKDSVESITFNTVGERLSWYWENPMKNLRLGLNEGIL